jgi:hypothetical protein
MFDQRRARLCNPRKINASYGGTTGEGEFGTSAAIFARDIETIASSQIIGT